MLTEIKILKEVNCKGVLIEKGDSNMKKIIEELNKKVSEAIGCGIGVNHIHTDFEGWDYYIPAKSLQENHPLILNHYRGPLFMVIPYKDWERLKSGTD